MMHLSFLFFFLHSYAICVATLFILSVSVGMNAEHSMYFMAPISSASCCPASVSIAGVPQSMRSSTTSGLLRRSS